MPKDQGHYSYGLLHSISNNSW